MAQNVSILTWNVQNYGPTKMTFTDIVNAIVRTVVAVAPDIFILLEVNTNSNATATLLMNRLAKPLYQASGGRYRLCVRSPNTGVEYYGFFIRDHTLTQPLIAVKKTGGDAPVIGKRGVSFAQMEFRAVAAAGQPPRLAPGIFPLLAPDFPAYTQRGRPLGVLDWPGVRLPVLGMFWCPNAGGANRLLPIVACHFAANHNVARQQVRALNTFSLLQGVGPPDPAGRVPVNPLQVDVLQGGALRQVPVPGYVLTGDFNLNYLDPAEAGLYQPATGAAFPNLGATLYINQGTHLTTYRNYTRTMTNTAALAVNDYDNILVRNSPAAMTPATVAAPGVRNVAEDIRVRRLNLYQSVDHYDELDMKGFSGGQYNSFAVNFANQLGRAGQFAGTPINVKGALVGARLISDHLPVYATLQLA